MRSRVTELAHAVAAALDLVGDYCVIGGYDDLPVVSSDLDVLMGWEDIQRVPAALAALGVSVVSYRDYAPRSRVLVVGATDVHLTGRVMHLDLSHDVRALGTVLFGHADAVANAEAREVGGVTVRVAGAADEFCYYLVKKLYKARRQRVTPAQVARLEALLARSHGDVIAPLRRALGRRLASRIIESIERRGIEPTIEAYARRWYLMPRLVARRPATAVVAAAQDVGRRVRRVLRPTGVSVGVLGVDGAGKSTVIDGVSARLASVLWGIDRFHLRVGVLVRRGGSGAASVRPHDQAPRSSLGSFAKLCALVVEYWMGAAVVRGATSSSRLVLFDRCAYDVAIDPIRHRMNLADRWLRLLPRCTPPLDLTLVLTGDPERMHARKPETSIAAVSELTTRYRSLTGRGVVHIDANRESADVVAESARVIIDLLRDRTARRLEVAADDHALRGARGAIEG